MIKHHLYSISGRVEKPYFFSLPGLCCKQFPITGHMMLSSTDIHVSFDTNQALRCNDWPIDRSFVHRAIFGYLKTRCLTIYMTSYIREIQSLYLYHMLCTYLYELQQQQQNRKRSVFLLVDLNVQRNCRDFMINDNKFKRRQSY